MENRIKVVCGICQAKYRIFIDRRGITEKGGKELYCVYCRNLIIPNQ